MTSPVINRRARLVGMLTLLRDGLAPVVDDLLAGDAPQDQLDQLADRLETVAEELRSAHPIVIDTEQELPMSSHLGPNKPTRTCRRPDEIRETPWQAIHTTT